MVLASDREKLASGPASAQERGRSRFIPEIEGLRAVAIILVVIYHVWFNRVSGGVDVFLMLSGLLITSSLTRELERSGRISLPFFYSRIVRRILPAALLVLVGIVAAMLLFLPQVRWGDTLQQAIATALYYENWQLAENSVDYLAARNAASPLQHYWSLSVQGQFYLVWPVLLLVAAGLARWVSVRARRAAVVACGLVFAGSLAYSVYSTQVEPTYAYFDTFTRVWQFALGGLIGFALPHLRVGKRWKVLLGWLGMAALLTCGLLFEGDQYPGYVALWPTMAAALIITAVSSDSRIGVDRILRSRPLRWLGGVSYGLYLWHWPIFICYLAYTDRTSPSWKGALAIVALSLLLAWGTKRLYEDRVYVLRQQRRPILSGYAIGAVCLTVALGTVTAVVGYVDTKQTGDARLDPMVYPGAAYLAEGGQLPNVAYRPSSIEAKDDSRSLHSRGCQQNPGDAEVLVCEFGSPLAEVTVALVGGSHSGQWFPALFAAADEHDVRIITMIKGSCPLTTELLTRKEKPYHECSTWNQNVLDKIVEVRPDIVFTTSTRGDQGPDDTPEGYIEQWRALDELGFPVVAVRDNPRFDVDMAECVERHGPDSKRCGGTRAEFRLDKPADVLGITDIPDNVNFVDMTGFLCDPDFCPGVIGNVLVYHDTNHITGPYARTVAPYLYAEMREIMNRVSGR